MAPNDQNDRARTALALQASTTQTQTSQFQLHTDMQTDVTCTNRWDRGQYSLAEVPVCDSSSDDHLLAGQEELRDPDEPHKVDPPHVAHPRRLHEPQPRECCNTATPSPYVDGGSAVCNILTQTNQSRLPAGQPDMLQKLLGECSSIAYNDRAKRYAVKKRKEVMGALIDNNDPRLNNDENCNVRSENETVVTNTQLHCIETQCELGSGDGQYDSHSFPAKYLVYSLMDLDTGLLVDFELVQKGMVKGELERAACENIMENAEVTTAVRMAAVCRLTIWRSDVTHCNTSAEVTTAVRMAAVCRLTIWCSDVTHCNTSAEVTTAVRMAAVYRLTIWRSDVTHCNTSAEVTTAVRMAAVYRLTIWRSDVTHCNTSAEVTTAVRMAAVCRLTIWCSDVTHCNTSAEVTTAVRMAAVCRLTIWCSDVTHCNTSAEVTTAVRMAAVYRLTIWRSDVTHCNTSAEVTTAVRMAAVYRLTIWRSDAPRMTPFSNLPSPQLRPPPKKSHYTVHATGRLPSKGGLPGCCRLLPCNPLRIT
ncbi:hypothetical protein PR048_033016 [Dryococelus australis]|uniref:Uncharacterized protein n=1 Tax=Dryococelus australis TaxID=614101 RepID=A0ABQ9G513_9NEOP|nr:hypothetical protein PR048_033016 [Dryococelus australis]